MSCQLRDLSFRRCGRAPNLVIRAAAGIGKRFAAPASGYVKLYVCDLYCTRLFNLQRHCPDVESPGNAVRRRRLRVQSRGACEGANTRSGREARLGCSAPAMEDHGRTDDRQGTLTAVPSSRPTPAETTGGDCLEAAREPTQPIETKELFQPFGGIDVTFVAGNHPLGRLLIRLSLLRPPFAPRHIIDSPRRRDCATAAIRRLSASHRRHCAEIPHPFPLRRDRSSIPRFGEARLRPGRRGRRDAPAGVLDPCLRPPPRIRPQRRNPSRRPRPLRWGFRSPSSA